MEEKGKYQLLPPLTEDEYEVLKADIAARGVQVPVEYDEEGNILDGYHRVRACLELGIKEFPRIVRAGMTEEEKVEHVLALNLHRRHLTREQRRELVAALRQQGWSLPRIARRLGISVGTAHRDTQASEIGNLPDTIIGADGKQYPATKPKPSPSIFVTTAKEQERAAQALQRLKDAAPAKFLDLDRAECLARERANKECRRQQTEPVTRHGDVEIRLGDFREVLTDLEGQVDAIITDPPYAAEYLPLYSDLSKVAARLLKPTGVLVVMVGQSHLPEYITRLSEHLAYRWVAAYLTGVPRLNAFGARVGTGWKPLLIFVRKDAGKLRFLNSDVFGSASRARVEEVKQHHPWEQALPDFIEIVERFTEPGELVVDPFLGSGTTALACQRLGRRFVGCDIDPAVIETARRRLQLGEGGS